jgi:FAD/FMN-containing dehydrogenase
MKTFSQFMQTALSDWDKRKPLPSGFTDDASHLNLTPITEAQVLAGSGTYVEDQLRTHLQRARDKKLPLSIIGARHSMGGQTFTPGGIGLNMLRLRQMHLDEHRNILYVQAGAYWSDVLGYLDLRQRSPSVMQSNNSFSIGGSLSANCHGWQRADPPVASTVMAFRLMLADGTIIRCSRDEHAELFSLVLGGYGLFGILIDAELSVCSNALYHVTGSVMPSASYPAFYKEHRAIAKIGLTYGRFNLEPEHFLREIYATTYWTIPGGELPPLSKPGFAKIRRLIFRGSVDNTSAKALRWKLETQFSGIVQGKTITRNTVLNESVEVFANRSMTSTDILQEYFVPINQLEPFLERVRAIIPAYHANLLNVTIRYLAADEDSFLRYADQDMFALVMLFNQPRALPADLKQGEMTRALIEAALQIGGRYYLPYRLHASVEQFYRAYPQAQEFFALKRKYDPEELFQNEFYRKYRRG